MACVSLALALYLGGMLPAAPSNCRLYLVSQCSWGEKRGFYLDLEGSTLAELPVILGAADGADWRFISHSPPFVTGKTFQVRGVVGPEATRLFVDGVQVAESEGAWQPFEGDLEVHYRPSWADERGDWLPVVEKVEVAVSREGKEVERKVLDFGAEAPKSVALALFQPGMPRRDTLVTQPGDTVTLDVALRFEDSDLRRWAPFVDEFGQAVHGEWPEKVRSEEELKADREREEAELAKMPPSEDFDEYGGYLKAGWREEGTDFFHTLKRDGYWWLITPLGNPCLYLGVCSVPGAVWETTPVSGREFLYEWLPPRDGPWASAWSKNGWGIQDGTEYVCFYTCNLIRKYGDDWGTRVTEQALKRLKAWGFSGGGKWGAPDSMVSTPVLHRWGTPSLEGHPDVFDPKVRERFRAELEEQVVPRRDDPRVLGWSLGNEFDEHIKPDEVMRILARPAETSAKRALLDWALDELYGGFLEKLAAAWNLSLVGREGLYAVTPQPPGTDLEKLRQHYAREYYGFIYRTVKELDSNHLYLGFWIVPGWWVNEDDWRLIAPYCDVMGYDRYNPQFEDDRLRALKAETDKPVLCGEFSYPAWYNGTRGFGQYGTSATDDAEAGELYTRWVKGMARDPYSLGSIWFILRDQPLTGRGPGHGEALTIGEHFAFGLVTETDRPKWPLVTRMREANLQAARWRLEASRGAE